MLPYSIGRLLGTQCANIQLQPRSLVAEQVDWWRVHLLPPLHKELTVREFIRNGSRDALDPADVLLLLATHEDGNELRSSSLRHRQILLADFRAQGVSALPVGEYVDRLLC